MSQDFLSQQEVNDLLNGFIEPTIEYDLFVLDIWELNNQKFFKISVNNKLVTDWLFETFEIGKDFSRSSKGPTNTRWVITAEVMMALIMKFNVVKFQ